MPRPGLDFVTGLCLALVGIHAVIFMGGGVPEWREVYEGFGISVEGIRDGGMWQFVTYGFLHGSWFHVISNVVMLWLVGGKLQMIVGQRRVAETVLLGIVFGGVFHLLVDVILGAVHFRLLVGASGSVLACLLMTTVLSPDSRMFPLPVSGRNLGMGIMMASAILLLMQPGMPVPVLGEVGSWMEMRGLGGLFMVSHACHLGGGVAGLIMAKRVLGRRITAEVLRRERMKREGVSG